MWGAGVCVFVSTVLSYSCRHQADCQRWEGRDFVKSASFMLVCLYASARASHPVDPPAMLSRFVICERQTSAARRRTRSSP